MALIRGQVVAGRFEIERLSGSGGMGQVYRARDLTTGLPVAVKILYGTAEAQRFAREARAIWALRHAGIVEYVAYGATDGGALYLAMEWLEGETLLACLRRRRLAVAESVALGKRVAEALGAVHQRGFVHRDIKPSNIFLVGGVPESAKLIDFGIVRATEVGEQLTAEGAILGTPGYVSPEQARGTPDIDARADVFSLGCVLFACLAGRGAFLGEDPISVLLKVVLEEPPRLREIDPSIPAALDDLVARMLAKERDLRPAGADVVAAELAALDTSGYVPSAPPAPALPAPPTPSAGELTTLERQVLCLVLARPASGAADPDEERDRELRAVAETHRGRIERFSDGSLLLVFASAGAATDLATRAARCALALRSLLGRAKISVVSGRGVLAPGLPVGGTSERPAASIAPRAPMGELIDRAVVQLAPQRTRAADAATVIRLDEVTARLLGARFAVSSDEAGFTLRDSRDRSEETRTLLGKRTACVGRERELGVLDVSFAQCVEEPMSGAVLVTGPAGIGKSRMRDELLRKLRDRDDPPEIWLAQGDVMSAGSAFGLLSQAIRRAAGLVDGEPLDVRQRKLRARVARRVQRDVARVTEFLGELVGAPFPGEDSLQLRAARRDPLLLGDQVRRASEDFLRAECEAQPVVLVLDDLHWGDLPTVKFVDGALRNLRELPFLVVALARPEVHTTFPELWVERSLQVLRLGPLTRRAGERLIRQVLGDEVDAETVKRLLERADGHAFYLEELIRAVAEGKGQALPETVLAMVQARLEGLDSGARRILRAASVFGRSFWERGAEVLVGGPEAAAPLARLAEKELVARSAESRLSGEVEYVFRSALVWEAAYAMLTDEDRTLGHKLAGEWLEGAGEHDAMLLGEHFERGGEPARAAGWYRRAAEQSFEGNDLEAALARAERGVVCLSTAPRSDLELLGALRLIQARAHRWRGENAEAQRRGLEAMDHLPHGSAPWCGAAAEVIAVSSKLSNTERFDEITSALLVLDGAGAAAARAIALARAAVELVFQGRYDRVDALLDRAEALAQRLGDDVVVEPFVHLARATQALAAGDAGLYLHLIEACRASFARLGDVRNTCLHSISVGYGHIQLGSYPEAERVLREVLPDVERMRLHAPRTYLKHNLGPALAYQGKLAEARAFEEEAIAEFRAQTDQRGEAASRVYLAVILTLARDLDGAAREALAAIDDPSTAPTCRSYALAVLARARLAQGRTGQALEAAREAIAILESLGGIEEGESTVRLAYAEALKESGDELAADEAVANARDRLLARAEKIADAALRRGFLEHVPENAKTLALARRWLDGDARHPG